jgi:hypothetical protein
LGTIEESTVLDFNEKAISGLVFLSLAVAQVVARVIAISIEHVM